MPRLGTLLRRTLAPAAACALALAACGSQHRPPAASTATNSSKPPPKSNHTVYIYSSLPLTGPEAAASAQVQRGIQLALRQAHGRVPRFKIRYRALDDSIVKRTRRGQIPVFRGTGWNPAETIRNAERAARNPQTVAYIGDLDTGATMLSLPILNEAGIAQLTPGSGYPGLTDAYKGITQQGEPGRYTPQPSTKTLLRLIPNDTVQASAALAVLHGDGCKKVGGWEFDATTELGATMEATALLNAVVATAPKYGMQYYKPPALPAATKDYYTYAHDLASSGIHCAVFVGRVTRSAVALTTYLRTQLQIPIVGTSGFCNAGWVRGIARAVAKSVVPGLYCTTPARPVTEAQYPATTKFVGRFIGAFRHRYHRQPLAYDYYGYVAAELVIAALKDAAPSQDARQQVTSGLFGDLPSIDLNTYTFDDAGDLGSFAYGVDSFVNGAPKHYKTVTPDARHLLTSAG